MLVSSGRTSLAPRSTLGQLRSSERMMIFAAAGIRRIASFLGFGFCFSDLK
jgi:hypothetical protein